MAKTPSATLREKCPYSEFSWSIFSLIRTEYGPGKLGIRTLFTLCTPLQLLYLHRRNSSLVHCFSFYPRFTLPSSGLWDKNCLPELGLYLGDVFQYLIFGISVYLLTEICILFVLSSILFHKQTVNKQPLHDIPFHSYHKQLSRI